MRTSMSLLLALTIVLPAFSAPQIAVSSSNWDSLQVLRPGDKTEVVLKSGKKTKGQFQAVSGTAFTVLVNNNAVDLQPGDIARVYRKKSKHIGKTTAVGALAGATAGAGIGAAVGDDDCTGFLCMSRGGTAILGAIIFVIPGAIGGLVYGVLHNNSELIYESKSTP